MKSFKEFINESSDVIISSIVDLSNLVSGLKVINKTTGVILSIKALEVNLHKWGYKVSYSDGDINYKKGKSIVTISPYDEAKTKFTITVA